MPTRFEATLGRGRLFQRYRIALLVLIVAAPAGAQEVVPPALHDWESWVLHGHENHRCPWLAPGSRDYAQLIGVQLH